MFSVLCSLFFFAGTPRANRPSPMLLDLISAAYAALRVTLAIGVLRLPQPSSRGRPFVSIVVASHNDAPKLAVLLDDLAAQEYAGYEIIVVDDRSSDGTGELLAERKRRDPRLRALRVDRVSAHNGPKINALALGTSAARGELLLLTDADCRVPPTWVATMVACFEPDIGAVIGLTELLAPNGTLFERLQGFDYFAMMALAAGAASLGQPIGAGGANLAYRRAALDAAGGFASLPPGVTADDMPMVEQVCTRTGWRVAFCTSPAGHAASDAEPTWRRLISQRARWMNGGGDVLRRNSALLATGTILGLHNSLLFCFPLLLKRRATREALLRMVAVRLLADLLHLGATSARIGNARRLWLLPLWVLTQAPYAMLLPLLGMGQKVRQRAHERHKQNQ